MGREVRGGTRRAPTPGRGHGRVVGPGEVVAPGIQTQDPYLFRGEVGVSEPNQNG